MHWVAAMWLADQVFVDLIKWPVSVFSKVVDRWKVPPHLFCNLSVTSRDGIKERCRWRSTWAAQRPAGRTATRPCFEHQHENWFLSGEKEALKMQLWQWRGDTDTVAHLSALELCFLMPFGINPFQCTWTRSGNLLMTLFWWSRLQ